VGATPGLNKARKSELTKSGKINCSFCPYHKNENQTRRKPRSDRYKTERKR
jgi:hypothetical protein